MSIHMEEITRYFIDSKLGRGRVRTCRGEDNAISIDLEIYLPGKGPFAVHMKEPSEFWNSLLNADDQVLFYISRVAISQLKLQVRKKSPVPMHLELDCKLHPWIGDLTEKRYLRSTTEYGEFLESRAATRIRRIASLYLRHIKS